MSKIFEEAVELEQKPEASAGAAASPAEPDMPAEEAAPVLAYEEIPAPKPEAKLKVTLVRKKSRKAGILALAACILLAGAGAAVYLSGTLERVSGFEGFGVKNNTEPPAAAKIPAFSPINPADFASGADENFVVVPDETGLELPAFGHGPQVAPAPQNYYIQTPHVSGYFTDAAQDESYVYFLQQNTATGKYGLRKLMRANPATGKTEPATNNDESSVYSFALLGYNIITCEYKESTDTFAFYRNPKSGEHAQMLFETDSPAYMSVFDDKLFMLFVEEQTLGVFDLAADTQPSHIALEPLGDTEHYYPRFSVINGYLYYGIWYDADSDGQADAKYLRRSLYTGETVTLLSNGDGDIIQNPCWDNEGGAYYVQYHSEASEFNLIAVKDGGSPQTIASCDYGESWPLVALRDDLIIATVSRYELRQFSRADFSQELEATAETFPYAVTKDYLVCLDGLYRIFDFSYIPFT